EVETLQHIREAIVSTGAILLLALALVSYLVTVQIVRPVRRASQTALRLASGDLDERMVVKGSDEIAMLADSMNVMAEDLQARIHQLEQLSQLERRFVSDVSHELRTPMTTIKMAADLLYGERASFAPQAARTAELMSDEIDRFDELLADLLEISRFDAGAAVLTLERTDVVDLVAGEISAQNSFAAKLGTSIELQAESEVTARVDRRRIRRIVRNLLTNAIEHAEGKPITVKVAAADDEVSIEVIDQGVGFDEEQAEHVFERFWRADPSRTRVVGGSGLGLSIAQEDARLHGGKILAEGQPDQGARFQVQFPQRLRSGDKPAASEAQS
ncbi:MAG: two-component sensor histidine kinase, partial [Arachnia propionica]